MTAGRGIAHSGRTGAEQRDTGSKLYGTQTWIAPPKSAEQTEPDFSRHGCEELPLIKENGARIRLIAGTLFGQKAPSRTFSDMFYADVALDAGAQLPIDAGQEGRSLYTLSGEIESAGDVFGPGQLLVFRPGDGLAVTARPMLQAAAAMDGPRIFGGNFASSSKDRIDQTRADWRTKRFASIPGDEEEYRPLPKS